MTGIRQLFGKIEVSVGQESDYHKGRNERSIRQKIWQAYDNNQFVIRNEYYKQMTGMRQLYGKIKAIIWH